MASLYTSMAGLETTSSILDTTAQNIANVNTAGYAAAQTAAFGLPYAGQAPLLGADVIPLQEQVDIAAGPMQHTGDPLDLAPQGGAWLVVQTAAGPALTRNGQLSVNSAGLLTNQTGDPVIGVGGQPISLPRLQKVEVGEDGTISGIPVGAASQDPKVYGQILLASTPKGGNLTPIANSLYALPTGSQPKQDLSASIKQGFLMGSNADPTSSMVTMISASKLFQLQTQLVEAGAKTQTSLDQTITQG